jgi:hypothetical protein
MILAWRWNGVSDGGHSVDVMKKMDGRARVAKFPTQAKTRLELAARRIRMDEVWRGGWRAARLILIVAIL